MVEIEVDGRKISAPEGTPVLQAAYDHGIHIPHFCYHKKLSIAASCRMCLVEVENAPRPMPSCAIPVTPGMKVHTHSKLAVEAQKAVLEFLLINHPLDCPICDQGGECKLQDLTMGYGPDTSRFTEEKRVAFVRNVGPLLDLRGMSRCIHCSRCVRFGEEIAGMQELGMMNRGDRSQIMSFVNHTVDSELSGNMIDLCPVGAILSKPFRYQARNWELSSHPSFSPHDSLGSNMVIQSRGGKVLRVLPFENEAVNECWISDRDRFSYESLNSPERLTRPRVKQDGKWIETDWQTALDYVAHGLSSIARDFGPGAIAALAAPWSTLEEMALLAKLVRGLGSDNIEFRLRRSDFALDGKGSAEEMSERDGMQGAQHAGTAVYMDVHEDSENAVSAQANMSEANVKRSGRSQHRATQQTARAAIYSGIPKVVPWLGMPVAQVNRLDGLLLIGSFLRKDQPLLAARVRDAARNGAQVSLLHAVDDDLLMPIAGRMIAAPSAWLAALGEVVAAVADSKGIDAPAGFEQANPSDEAKNIAASLISGERKAVWLGSAAAQHPQASKLHAAAEWIARETNATLGYLVEGGNAVGGYLADAFPAKAEPAFATPRQAYVLLHAEPLLDGADPVAAKQALSKAAMVVVMSPFAHGHDYADVMLPIAPFTETAGTFVNMEGKAQSFEGSVLPLGDARPAWKVLRVLGNYLELNGFDYESSEEVRDEITLGAIDLSARLNNLAGLQPEYLPSQAGGIERIADVPIYFSDAYARRARALQHTTDARPPRAFLPQALADKLKIGNGDMVRVRQGDGGAGETVLTAKIDETLPQNTVRVAAAHELTASLGPMFGTVSVEKA